MISFQWKAFDNSDLVTVDYQDVFNLIHKGCSTHSLTQCAAVMIQLCVNSIPEQSEVLPLSYSNCKKTIYRAESRCAFSPPAMSRVS